MSENSEIKYISDREIWVGNNRTILKEGNIIHVIAIGPQDINIANAQTKVNQQLTQLINGKVNYLIDLNKAGKSSPEARKIWKEMSDLEATIKVAIIGAHPVARVLAAFVMSITQNRNVGLFNTEEEGINWLKAE